MAKHKYITNKDFYNELIRCQASGEISEQLGKYFMLLATKFASKPCFAGYSYREEMVSDAMLVCCEVYKKFDANKSSNAFAYFSQCIYIAFVKRLNLEKAHQEIRDQLLCEANLAPSFSYLESGESE